MGMMRKFYLIVFSFILLNTGFAEGHEIAITIDDLPFVGTNSNDEGNLRRSRERFLSIVQSLVEYQVPATGFVIAGAIGKGQWELLETFRQQGFAIGNHTYSHANLNRTSSEQYIAEIDRADKVLSPVMTEPKYFRYPYLAEGKGQTKQDVTDFLAANQYTIAPVTIDSKDYLFNERLLNVPWRVRSQSINRIKREYLAYIWKQTLRAEKSSHSNGKEILLIHANLINSHCLGDIISMYKEHGYRFITLDEALATNEPANHESTIISVPELSMSDSFLFLDDNAQPIPTMNYKHDKRSILCAAKTRRPRS